MKKCTAWCLVLAIALFLVGCGNTDSEGKISETGISIDENKPTWAVDSVNSNDTAHPCLSPEDAVVLEELLASDNWIPDVGNCGVDVTLIGDAYQLSYHSECGTFNDLTNHRSLQLNEHDKDSFNELLSKYVDIGK